MDLVIQSVTFLGCLSDPFKGLSDLQLGDEKVTLNHLGCVYFTYLDKREVSKWLVNGILITYTVLTHLVDGNVDFLLMLMGKYNMDPPILDLP